MLLSLQIITSIITAGLMCGLAIKLVHVFQLDGYRVNLFAKWCLRNRTRYVMTLLVLGVLGFGSTAILRLLLLCFNISEVWSYFGLLFFLGLSICTIYLTIKKPVKVPLKYTKRVIRLLTLTTILSVLLSFVVLKFTAIWMLPFVASVLPFVLLISAIILCPLEKFIKYTYIRKAKNKLFSNQYKDLIRIGIAGSYGKTTCKSILAQMLEQKYKTVASPASYNTPMGFVKTVLENLQPGTEVLIMEMGERYQNDIKEMCNLVKPHHGIVTHIGKAHLDTLGSVENVERCVMELVNSIPENGVKVIGNDRDNFDICAEMALALGITHDQIEKVRKELKPVPHRLEIIENENGVKIIDDSYNSNPDGAILALGKLAELKTSKAVIMTPGMVELGDYQYDENKTFAENMGKVADEIIIVGEENKKSLLDGLKNIEYNKENIHCVPDVESAKKLFPKLLNRGDVLLIENDLPDNF